MMLANNVVAPKNSQPPLFFHAVVLSERELKIENIVIKKLYNVKLSIQSRNESDLTEISDKNTLSKKNHCRKNRGGEKFSSSMTLLTGVI